MSEETILKPPEKAVTPHRQNSRNQQNPPTQSWNPRTQANTHQAKLSTTAQSLKSTEAEKGNEQPKDVTSNPLGKEKQIKRIPSQNYTQRTYQKKIEPEDIEKEQFITELLEKGKNDVLNIIINFMNQLIKIPLFIPKVDAPEDDKNIYEQNKRAYLQLYKTLYTEAKKNIKMQIGKEIAEITEIKFCEQPYNFNLEMYDKYKKIAEGQKNKEFTDSLYYFILRNTDYKFKNDELYKKLKEDFQYLFIITINYFLMKIKNEILQEDEKKEASKDVSLFIGGSNNKKKISKTKKLKISKIKISKKSSKNKKSKKSSKNKKSKKNKISKKSSKNKKSKKK